MTNLRERNIVVTMILAYVTCGIYGIYLFFALGSEIKNEGAKYGENLTDPFVAFLLTLVTCGIYGIYYVWKQADVLQKISADKQFKPMDPVIVLLLTIFVGIGSYINVYSASMLAKESSESYSAI